MVTRIMSGALAGSVLLVVLFDAPSGLRDGDQP